MLEMGGCSSLWRGGTVVSSVVGLTPVLFACLEFACSSSCMTVNVSPVMLWRLVQGVPWFPLVIG